MDKNLPDVDRAAYVQSCHTTRIPIYGSGGGFYSDVDGDIEKEHLDSGNERGYLLDADGTILRVDSTSSLSDYDNGLTFGENLDGGFVRVANTPCAEKCYSEASIRCQSIVKLKKGSAEAFQASSTCSGRHFRL